MCIYGHAYIWTCAVTRGQVVSRQVVSRQVVSRQVVSRRLPWHTQIHTHMHASTYTSTYALYIHRHGGYAPVLHTHGTSHINIYAYLHTNIRMCRMVGIQLASIFVVFWAIYLGLGSLLCLLTTEKIYFYVYENFRIQVWSHNTLNVFVCSKKRVYSYTCFWMTRYHTAYVRRRREVENRPSQLLWV